MALRYAVVLRVCFSYSLSLLPYSTTIPIIVRCMSVLGTLANSPVYLDINIYVFIFTLPYIKQIHIIPYCAIVTTTDNSGIRIQVPNMREQLF